MFFDFVLLSNLDSLPLLTGQQGVAGSQNREKGGKKKEKVPLRKKRKKEKLKFRRVSSKYFPCVPHSLSLMRK